MQTQIEKLDAFSRERRRGEGGGGGGGLAFMYDAISSMQRTIISNILSDDSKTMYLSSLSCSNSSVPNLMVDLQLFLHQSLN